MNSSTGPEIAIAVAFLLSLLLPVTFGTGVTRPRSVLDFVNGLSTFNRSLYKLLAPPGLGLVLVIVLFSDPSVPWFFSLVAFAVASALVVGALMLGAKRGASIQPASIVGGQDDGLDYAERFRRLEDQIESSS